LVLGLLLSSCGHEEGEVDYVAAFVGFWEVTDGTAVVECDDGNGFEAGLTGGSEFRAGGADADLIFISENENCDDQPFAVVGREAVAIAPFAGCRADHPPPPDGDGGYTASVTDGAVYTMAEGLERLDFTISVTSELVGGATVVTCDIQASGSQAKVPSPNMSRGASRAVFFRGAFGLDISVADGDIGAQSVDN
jgi:hypothetical protein